MNARYMFSLIAVIVLFLIAWAGTAVGLQVLFGIIIPYLALLVFLAGFAYKVVGWSRSAVGEAQCFRGCKADAQRGLARKFCA